MVSELHSVAGIYLICGHTYVTGQEYVRDVRFYIGESQNIHQRAINHRGSPKTNSGIHGATSQVVVLLELPLTASASVRRQHELRFLSAARRMRLNLTNTNGTLWPMAADDTFEAESLLLAEAVRLFAAKDKSLLKTHQMVESYMQRRFSHAS